MLLTIYQGTSQRDGVTTDGRTPTEKMIPILYLDKLLSREQKYCRADMTTALFYKDTKNHTDTYLDSYCDLWPTSLFLETEEQVIKDRGLQLSMVLKAHTTLT